MIEELWNQPLEITLDGGDHFRSVRNSREALACLMGNWPSKQGPEYAAAKRACLGATEHRSSSSEAYDAFANAADAVGILRH